MAFTNAKDGFRCSEQNWTLLGLESGCFIAGSHKVTHIRCSFSCMMTFPHLRLVSRMIIPNLLVQQRRHTPAVHFEHKFMPEHFQSHNVSDCSRM